MIEAYPGLRLVVSYKRAARGRLTGSKVHGRISYRWVSWLKIGMMRGKKDDRSGKYSIPITSSWRWVWSIGIPNGAIRYSYRSRLLCLLERHWIDGVVVEQIEGKCREQVSYPCVRCRRLEQLQSANYPQMGCCCPWKAVKFEWFGRLQEIWNPVEGPIRSI